MIQEKDVYKIGRIGKTHGIHGELQMQVDDDVFDRVESGYVILRVDGILVPFFMDEYRFKNDDIALVKFCDIDSAEKARQLTGCEVFFERRLAEDGDDELTYAELVGYEIYDDTTGKLLGKIAFVDDMTENMLFELEDGTLLPASEELITDVDQEHHTLTLTIPEGLLEL